MDHLMLLVLVLSCFALVHGYGGYGHVYRDANADVRDGEPSWCDQYKAYCEHLQVRTQCIKTCNATAIVDPSWCQNYKPYCKNNPSIQSQCPLTCALAVNGNWGSWAMWAACSTSCGKGVQTRTRECNQPAPKNGGEECDMDGGHGMKELQSRECSADKCPNHGGYSAWSAYTDCSKSCGGGIQYKSRCCINPFPSNGGDDCSKIGPPVEAKVCNTMPCPIDGAYGEWSDWSECTATCGSGMRHKKRECQNPEPKFGGKNCSLLGPMMMSEKCNMKPCPIDGRYTDWTPYSKCSKTCGSGLQHRARCCVDPAPAFGGKDCSVIGEPVEVKICQAAPCPIDGNWSEWNDWGVCTNKCGDDGVKMRQRTCDNPKPLFGGKDCAGSAAETVECNRKTCAVDGGFTEWTEWSDCSVSCSTGVHTKTRSCTNPTPEGSGKPCSGDTIMTKPCADKACPINGNWGPWEAYGACSEVCGDKGIKMRSRICNNPPPMFGGATCAGDAIESAECNRIICKVDGGFSEWTEWGTCSATCGTSEKTRSRTCTNPAPANGGTDCSGDLSETSSCTVPKCPEYKYGLDMLSWDGAETACQTWGGHLASVHSQTEMDLIINGFSAAGVSLEADVYAWIGLNDKVIQGKWIWIGGTEASSTYLPWGNGEPSQVDHHCVSTNLFAKTWWDRDCSTLYRYVCKK